MMRINVKYHAPIDALTKIGGKKSDWVDLRCAEEVEMKAGEFRYISLGVSIKMPKDHEAIVAARSSTFEKYGVLMANGIGVIDETYCGDGDVWKFPAYATRDTHIPFNARICQFRIFPHQQNLRFIRVETMEDPDRGGLGSSGRC